MKNYRNPSDYMYMSKEQLAYKLAEVVSYVESLSPPRLPKDGYFAFQREYADWIKSTDEKINLSVFKPKLNMEFTEG